MFTFEGHILFSSYKAVLFQGNYWHGSMWLPRSQIEIIPDGESCVVKVKPWLCKKNGINEFTEYDADKFEGMF